MCLPATFSGGADAPTACGMAETELGMSWLSPRDADALSFNSLWGRAEYHSTALLGAGPETGPHMTDSG